MADQLRYALDYRVVIERAIGYLMGSRGLDAVTAFDVLRKRTRDAQRRVAEVAAEMLAAAGHAADAGSKAGRKGTGPDSRSVGQQALGVALVLAAHQLW